MRRPDDVIRAGGLELAIGRVLGVGITLSSVCLGVGLALALAGVDASLARLLLTTGLMILLATPAARVVVSAIDYLCVRDWLFVTLTVIVLLELAASVLAAIYGFTL